MADVSKKLKKPPTKKLEIRAFYDRKKDSIEGLFTLVVNGKTVFKQLAARSGQNGYQSTNFVSGKSPIPLLGRETEYVISTQAISNGATIPTDGQIGRFYPICTSLKDRMRIVFSEGSRFAIGLHPENAFKGSLGCIVLVVDTPERIKAVLELFRMLDNFYIKGIKGVRLTVL
jgi:hypothetical protein